MLLRRSFIYVAALLFLVRLPLAAAEKPAPFIPSGLNAGMGYFAPAEIEDSGSDVAILRNQLGVTWGPVSASVESHLYDWTHPGWLPFGDGGTP